MPRYFITAVNGTASSSDNGADYADVEEAGHIGLKAAVAILNDEVEAGARATSIEVTIADQDGKPVKRSIVTIDVMDVPLPL